MKFLYQAVCEHHNDKFLLAHGLFTDMRINESTKRNIGSQNVSLYNVYRDDKNPLKYIVYGAGIKKSKQITVLELYKKGKLPFY